MTSAKHDLDIDMMLHPNSFRDSNRDNENRLEIQAKSIKQDVKARNHLFDLDIDLFMHPDAFDHREAAESSSKKRSAITEAINRTWLFDLDLDLLVNPDHLDMNPPKFDRQEKVCRDIITSASTSSTTRR